MPRRKPIEIVTFTPRQISQARAEKALLARLPEVLQETWLYDFRYQNDLLRQTRGQPVSAAEFICVKLAEFVGSNRSPF